MFIFGIFDGGQSGDQAVKGGKLKSKEGKYFV